MPLLSMALDYWPESKSDSLVYKGCPPLSDIIGLAYIGVVEHLIKLYLVLFLMSIHT